MRVCCWRTRTSPHALQPLCGIGRAPRKTGKTLSTRPFFMVGRTSAYRYRFHGALLHDCW
jgi:hypothetical protein